MTFNLSNPCLILLVTDLYYILLFSEPPAFIISNTYMRYHYWVHIALELNGLTRTWLFAAWYGNDLLHVLVAGYAYLVCLLLSTCFRAVNDSDCFKFDVFCELIMSPCNGVYQCSSWSCVAAHCFRSNLEEVKIGIVDKRSEPYSTVARQSIPT